MKTGWWRRARHREALAWLLALLVAGTVFSAWPQLDLQVAGWFYDGQGHFPGDHWWWVRAIYRGTTAVGWAVFLYALWSAWRSWRRSPGHRLRHGRRGWALALVMLLGVVVLVHGALKEQWGRPRPVHILQFGGEKVFSMALLPSSGCRTNCSFVSGHAATGFVLMAVGLMAAPAVRRRWWRAGMAAGALIGAVRIIQGGHFLSDVVFAGLAIWGCALLVRAGWLRWRLRRRRRRQASAA
ncbi:phosphatase PAP2 family protein [Ideonella azotifigens]|uniref:phosphatase PAP2 family protein n=1 Tax=Ideonella azotifigens TaxID=513160 RepID=UPI001E63EA2F|nr:phosphatase PAP2 family protein [Ideonella azotifigens]MCD2343046.1 phosphatase PAP2 family protein [Ideonella azotifigens]